MEGLKSVNMSLCDNCVTRKQKQVSFTKSATELKKSTRTTKPMGVEVELQNNSQSDVVAVTRETPEIIADKLEVKRILKNTILNVHTNN